MNARAAILTFAIATTFMVSPAPAHAGGESESADGLSQLLKDLAESPGLYAKFREDKQIALLADPIVSSGTIHFAPKQGLARHTKAPSKSSILVTEKELSMWDGHKTTTLSTSSSPTLKAFVEVLPKLLAADKAGIERNFSLRYAGDYRTGWTLKLEPKDDGLKAILKDIELRGASLVLKALIVREANDDSSSTTFTDVDPKRKYSAAETKKIFSLPR